MLFLVDLSDGGVFFHRVTFFVLVLFIGLLDLPHRRALIRSVENLQVWNPFECGPKECQIRFRDNNVFYVTWRPFCLVVLAGEVGRLTSNILQECFYSHSEQYWGLLLDLTDLLVVLHDAFNLLPLQV